MDSLLLCFSYTHARGCAQGGEDGGDGDTIVLEDDQDAHGIDDDVDNGVQKGGAGQVTGFGYLHIYKAGYGAGNDPGNGKDDNRKENVGE